MWSHARSACPPDEKRAITALFLLFFSEPADKFPAPSVDKFFGGGTGTIIKAYPEKVLPKNVTKIIFSDTDTIWVRDIYELWKVFDTMNSQQLYGMALEWSDWYWKIFPNLTFSQNMTGLPAARCGLNAGLHLLPLIELNLLTLPNISVHQGFCCSMSRECGLGIGQKIGECK